MKPLYILIIFWLAIILILLYQGYRLYKRGQQQELEFKLNSKTISNNNTMKPKYEKFKDTETGEQKYKITLPNKSEHWTSIELGNYMHQLEQRLRIGFNHKQNEDNVKFQLEESMRNEQAAREEQQRRNNY